MGDLQSVEKDFQLNFERNRQPVKVLQNGEDAERRWSLCNNVACRVLDQLEFKEDFFGSAIKKRVIKKRVAVICARGDKTEDEYGTEV